MNNDTKSMLLGLFAVTCFGLTLPVTRFTTTYMNSVFIGLGRACLASVVAAALLYLFKVSLPSRNQFKKLVVVAMGVVVGFPVLSALAMQSVPASHGGVVVGLLPLVTAIIGCFVSGERPSFGFWITGLVGGALVVSFTLIEGAGHFQNADLALVASVLFAGMGYAVGAQLAKEIPGWQVICWSLVIAFPFILVPAWMNRPDDMFAIPISVWSAFVYLSLISQLFGFFFWYKALAMGGVARVSQVQLLQTFVTLFAASLILGELIDASTIIFAVFVVLTVAVSKQMPVRQITTIPVARAVND